MDKLGKRAEIPVDVLTGRKSAVANQLDRMLENP
jgi:hypothetical protein